MQRYRKKVTQCTGDFFRDLPYGTIYYVEGTGTKVINEWFLEHKDDIALQVNQKDGNWISCKIAYMASENLYFQKNAKARLYSALLPCSDTPENMFNIFAAQLDVSETDFVIEAVVDYFHTLQQMVDEIMDTGHYQEHHLRQTILSASDDSGIRFMIHKQDNEGMLPISQTKEFAFTKPSRIEITPNKYQVLLPDYQTEFRFTAQVKALYILFLNHPEGIRMKEITDYKQEFKHIYFCLTNRSDMDRLRASVDQLLDVCNRNALDVKKSQCNRTIRQTIPDVDLQKYYEIEVNHGLPHKINLDRSIVKMPEILRV